MSTYKEHLRELRNFDFEELYASYANKRVVNNGEEFDHEKIAEISEKNFEYYKGLLDEIDAGK